MNLNAGLLENYRSVLQCVLFLEHRLKLTAFFVKKHLTIDNVWMSNENDTYSVENDLDCLSTKHLGYFWFLLRFKALLQINAYLFMKSQRKQHEKHIFLEYI